MLVPRGLLVKETRINIVHCLQESDRKSVMRVIPKPNDTVIFGFGRSQGTNSRRALWAFQWKTPLLLPSYCDHLTMEEACVTKGNTQIEMREKGEREENVCN